ncbi:hypothetical protein C942_00746 [Photobacterium marinum]|uniref:Uncharacterized protein n=1 Tax=Photobacterium marinum TaxID=1056511 RepID=L8JBL6_9GAMM|nr:hypothetical protein [Photobacterium marinum]ELR65663.1 hypothetical protein C942_00746 [Photobacterium marinum]
MLSSDVDGVKRDISTKVNDIFDSYERDHNCLPTMEEFRTLFDNYAEQYIGSDNRRNAANKKHEQSIRDKREMVIWQVASELEAEQRYLRAD